MVAARGGLRLSDLAVHDPAPQVEKTRRQLERAGVRHLLDGIQERPLQVATVLADTGASVIVIANALRLRRFA